MVIATELVIFIRGNFNWTWVIEKLRIFFGADPREKYF